ncbi:conopressin receptor 2 [Elysia marginata]|uniref:Conopressin receptor 2 n=1 Tax=Elysia marginata TaxID=1093978 RepID=A0AAV4IX41_9GAST|nr:conopressin receptor 2 [Elysia marginata]
MYLSTYMLVMTAVDRYLSVCHPLSSFNTSSKTKVYIMIAFAYILSAVLSLPQPIIFRYQEQAEFKVYDCWAYFDPVWTLHLYVTSFTVAVYLIPLVILVYTYVSICYAIWQKHKNSQSQYQLDAYENNTRLAGHSYVGLNNEAGLDCGVGTGTGALPGQKNSSSSRTHSTSSPMYPRGGADFGGEAHPRGVGIGGGGANYVNSAQTHRHHHAHSYPGGFYQFSNRYGAGSGTRGAMIETGTGISPSGLLSGARFRDGREAKHGRSDRGDDSFKKRGKNTANNRHVVGRSNAIRRRANLVVTATNGSARSSTGSVRGLSRAKMKTVKLTFVVIVAYIVCWTPFFVSQLWWLYDESQENNDAVVIMILLGSLNSCCNPLIYLSFSGKILRRVGLRRRRAAAKSSCSCLAWCSMLRGRCRCSDCYHWWRDSCSCSCIKTRRQHSHRANKHVNNNSSGREDHNKDGRSFGDEGEQFKAGFKVASQDVVCMHGIGVVPSIELRDIM